MSHPKHLATSDRSALIRLAATMPVGDPTRRAILEGLKKADAATPPQVAGLMASLKQVPGVKSVYVTDTWSDGYYHLRVVVEPKEGKNELGGWSGKIVEFESSKGRFGKFYNLPDYPKVIAVVRALVKRSGLTVENITGPTKVYEFQDQWAKANRTPRLSGYDGNEISVELYV